MTLQEFYDKAKAIAEANGLGEMAVSVEARTANLLNSKEPKTTYNATVWDGKTHQVWVNGETNLTVCLEVFRLKCEEVAVKRRDAEPAQDMEIDCKPIDLREPAPCVTVDNQNEYIGQ